MFVVTVLVSKCGTGTLGFSNLRVSNLPIYILLTLTNFRNSAKYDIEENLQGVSLWEDKGSSPTHRCSTPMKSIRV